MIHHYTKYPQGLWLPFPAYPICGDQKIECFHVSPTNEQVAQVESEDFASVDFAQHIESDLAQLQASGSNMVSLSHAFLNTFISGLEWKRVKKSRGCADITVSLIRTPGVQ